MKGSGARGPQNGVALGSRPFCPALPPASDTRLDRVTGTFAAVDGMRSVQVPVFKRVPNPRGGQYRFRRTK